MTTSNLQPFDPAAFLSDTHGDSFSQVGIYILIRSHLLLSPKRMMSRRRIHVALRVRSQLSRDLVDFVIAEMFETHANGAICLPRMQGAT